VIEDPHTIKHIGVLAGLSCGFEIFLICFLLFGLTPCHPRYVGACVILHFVGWLMVKASRYDDWTEGDKIFGGGSVVGFLLCFQFVVLRFSEWNNVSTILAVMLSDIFICVFWHHCSMIASESRRIQK